MEPTEAADPTPADLRSDEQRVKLSKSGEVIVDFGEKIGGARKDLAGTVTWDDIQKMTKIERLKYIQKPTVWPAPDYREMVEAQGYTVRAAAMVKMLHGAFAKAPSVNNESSEEAVEAATQSYAALLNAAKAVVSRGKTEEELAAAFRASPEVQEWFGTFAKPEPRPYSYSSRTPEFQFKGSPKFEEAVGHAFRGSYRETRDLVGTFHDFANGHLDGTMERQLRKNPKWPVAKTVTERWIEDSRVGAVSTPEGWRIGRYGHVPQSANELESVKRAGFADIAEKTFATKDEVEKAINDTAEAAVAKDRAAAKQKREALEQRALGVSEGISLVPRIGPEWRDGGFATGEDYQRAFGVRAGEFGNWVNQAERQECLNNGFDAFHDLASAFGLDPTHISLNGELAIGFGSRGRGGHAAAHYEPGRHVINLTKPSGEGCLAHEWAHALDHFLGTRAQKLGMVRSLKIGEHACYLSNVKLNQPPFGGQESDEASFLRRMHAAIESLTTNTDPQTKEDVILDVKQQRSERMATLMGCLKYIDPYLSMRPVSPERKKELLAAVEQVRAPRHGQEHDDFQKGMYQLLSASELYRYNNRDLMSRTQDRVLAANALLAERQALRDDWKGDAVPRKSGYFRACRALDDERSKDYFTLPHEMFARSMEAATTECLREKGRENQYLVAGASGEAYPMDRERERITKKLVPLIHEMAAYIPKVETAATVRKQPPLVAPTEPGLTHGQAAAAQMSFL